MGLEKADVIVAHYRDNRNNRGPCPFMIVGSLSAASSTKLCQRNFYDNKNGSTAGAASADFVTYTAVHEEH